MTLRKVGVSVFFLLAFLCAVPTATWAQSGIAGVVKDVSGGVLPGVTVSAASDALIEGAKTTVTDGAGLYKIVDLRPGVYTVTFTLEGFSTIKLTNIELPAEFTATVNGDMKIGALAETITVSGTNTLVDLKSAARVQTLNKDAIDNIPSSRTIQTMGQLIVGVRVEVGNPDVGGSNATEQSYMSVRGIPSTQNTVMVDGMVVNGLEANGAIQAYFNDAASDQIVYQTSDTAAANSGGGVQVNMIGRAGGNRFSGDSQSVYRPGQLQPDKLTDRIAKMGVGNPPGSVYISDVTIAQGGPIKRDKLWFFTAARDNRVNNYVLDTFFDNGDRGYDDNYVRDLMGRVTWQVHSKGKLQGYFDKVWKFKGHEMGALDDPETSAGHRETPDYSTGSIKYTWVATNRMFIEGGYSFNNEIRDTSSTGGVIARLMEDPSRQSQPNYQQNAWYASARRLADGAQMVSDASSFAQQYPRRKNLQASLAYVTGSHSIKAGFGYEMGTFFHSAESHGDLTAQTYDRFVQDPVTHNFTFIQPESVTITNTPRQSQETMKANMGLYAQDQWTLKRLTLNYGLRWEWVNSQVEESTSPAGRWVPARTQPLVEDRPDWTDWAPRFSMVYDVFGNGKTALRYSVNRYNTAETTNLASGFNLLGATPTTGQAVRQWTDLNGDDIAQGQRTWNADGTAFTDCVYQTAGCEIYLSGPAGVNPITGLPQTLTSLAANFGVLGSLPVYPGFPRLYRIEHGIEVQHQVLPRLGMTFGWSHWDRFNNTKQVNQFRQAFGIDYQTYQAFNPVDGTPLPFLYYDLLPAASTRQSATGAVIEDLEPKLKVFYDSFQTEFRARPWAGAQMGGGITLERTRTTNCETSKPGLFVDPNSLRFCDQTDLRGDGSGLTTPYTKSFKLNFSFPIMWGFTLSAAYQNLDLGAFNRTFSFSRTAQRYPGGALGNYTDAAGNIIPPVPCPAGQAVCAVPGAFTSPSTTNFTTAPALPIDIPGLNRDERLSQFDIKASRRFRVRQLTVSPTLEVFNLLAADSILDRTLSYANTAGTYLRPDDVLKPRTFGFGLIVKW